MPRRTLPLLVCLLLAAASLATSPQTAPARPASAGAPAPAAAPQAPGVARVRAVPARSSLPSGRTRYRVLADYNRELGQLARHHAGTARAFEFGRSYEGRALRGIELATDV